MRHQEPASQSYVQPGLRVADCGVSRLHAERLNDQPDVIEIVCTNTVPIPPDKRVPKLTVLSVAPALAEAMRRIHNGESVSVLFDSD